MTRFATIAALALFVGASSLALADGTAAPGKPSHPMIKEVHVRMHDQMMRIKEGVKSGKLTKDQAKALREVLKSVKTQMDADFQQNGKKELTEDQVKQLNQMLDENSKTIYGEKHDPSSTAPAGGPSSAPPSN